MSSKERRRLLKFAVKTRLVPHIHSLGFERTKTAEARARWEGLNGWDCDFGRRRDDRLDFLNVDWEKYGRPEFGMFFATCLIRDADKRPPLGWIAGRLHSGHHVLPWGLLGFGGNWFGPHQSADEALDLAIQRLAELDAFLAQPNPRATARIVQFGFNDYAPTLAGRWLHAVLIVLPRWLGRQWRGLKGSRVR